MQLSTLYRAFDSLKYTPIHPQWVANSWHLKKIELIKKHINQGLCLDIGSGNDRIEDDIQNDGLCIVKLDYPTTSQRYGNKPDIYGDVQQLPIETNSTDAVIFFEVIEHVPNDEAALREISRILKDSGLLFISAPFLYPTHDQPFDFRRYTSHGLRLELDKQGLEVIEVKPHGNSITTVLQLINLALLDSVKATSERSRPLALLLAIPLGLSCLISNLISFVFFDFQSPSALLLGHTIVARKAALKNNVPVG
ncbi:MAG: class I SAM-dependent methyltransferase [Pseudomonadales bacterium]|nr:class I SAM-dependent methyltransferase [Pseudomonadales bacterium]